MTNGEDLGSPDGMVLYFMTMHNGHLIIAELAGMV